MNADSTSQGLIRFERNLDSYPIWAPSSRRRDDVHEFKLSWISPEAKVRVHKLGAYGNLQWHDKLTLGSVVNIWEEQGKNPEGIVSFSLADLFSRLDLPDGGAQYRQLKDSLWRLRGCLIQYFNAFYNKETGVYASKETGENILNYLALYEYRKDRETKSLTHVRLNLDVVRNLLGNYSRPVSLKLWRGLSERGGLFEAYINSVLYNRDRAVQPIRKDVFELWDQLGLSYGGIKYASQLAARMRPDLDKIAGDRYSLLDRYSFEDGKRGKRYKNLVLYRRKEAFIDRQRPVLDDPDLFQSPSISQVSPTELDIAVERIRFELGDTSPDDMNIRRIVERMPRGVIEAGITDAVGRVKDGLIKKSAAAYFVGRMKKVAEERGIDLGFSDDPAPRRAEKESSKPSHARRRGREDQNRALEQIQIDAYIVTLTPGKRERLEEEAHRRLDERGGGDLHGALRAVAAEWMGRR